VWIGMTLVAAFIGPASAPFGIPDGLWSLLRGRWMAEHGTLLHADPFTSAPHVDGPMLNVQWLADLLLYAANRVGGLEMVIVWVALAVTLTTALLLLAAYSASPHLRLSCVAVWASYVLGATNFSPRPQTLAYPLFALFVLAVARAEWHRDTRVLWLLPFATALWANIHGSFFLGFVLLGCAAVGRVIATRQLLPARPYVLALLACLLASLVNPYGPSALVYVASIGSNPVIRDYVTEWAPTTIGQPEGILFFASLVVLGVLVLRARIRLTPVEIVCLLAFGYLAWSSVRVVVWWGIVLAPIVARLLGASFPSYQPKGRDRPLVNVFVLSLALAIAALSLPWTKSMLPILPSQKQGVFNSEAPVRVGEYLKAHDPPLSGRMLNHQAWGGYLEWTLWPRHTVFLDGRIELHPIDVWLDYVDLVLPSAHWRELFARYDISYAVLSKAEDAELIADLRADGSHWRVDYEDDQAVVLSRL
jgi:hypothetical protein